MNNVGITEKYALCMLKEKPKFYETELVPHLLVSMIIEMMLDENLEITEKNKIKLNEKEPIKTYNKKLYDIIKEKNKNYVSFENVISNLCYSFSDKKMKSVIDCLKEEMLNNNLITVDTKKSLLVSKEIIVINEDYFISITEEVRAELLEKGNLTEELILLGEIGRASCRERVSERV